MKKAGRQTDAALLRTVVNEKLQTFSHKRLIKDFQEIEREKIPTVGVTARPLENDFFTWHANIRGPEGTLYQGGVFHLELKFPMSYPNHPPTIRLFNNLPHPNVFGNFICLDMLQQDFNRHEEGAGWSSAYSVQSVLTQLQSFLFEEYLTGNKEQHTMNIKKAVKEANGFKCSICKHGGKLSLWPTFDKKEGNVQAFELLDEENDIIREELVCFHTKLQYTQNQLGLGVKISKIPRTGLIKEGEVYFDYISIKAFIKESMNKTSTNEKITHWLPVYFGQEDQEGRFCHFLKKAISMIMTNSTKNFKPAQAVEVFSKLFTTLAFHIMDEKKHPSIRIIRVLTHIHSMFLYCLKKFPELQEQVTATLANFLANEQFREKNSTPNLGCILALVSVCDSYKFRDVAEKYFFEQLDRQVFWILKKFPELISASLEEYADKKRSELVFKTQMTSFHIFCFYKLFITFVCEKRASRAGFLAEYEANLCKLTNKEENALQAEIKNISKNILTFNDFFNYTGLKGRDEKELLQMLKEAIKNSERKEYHSQKDIERWEIDNNLEKRKSYAKSEVSSKISGGEAQFRKLAENMPTYSRFITIAQEHTEKKGQHIYRYEEKISSDKEWREMCITRWSWIKEAMLADHSLSSSDIAQIALQITKKGVSKTEDRIVKLIESYKQSHLTYDEPRIDIPETDWKRLFLRLDLEDFLKYIDMNPDFNSFYEKLEVCQRNNLNTLLIPIVEVNNIKSGYFYITALLSKITTLKYLQFSGLAQINNKLNDKAAKSIKKGLHNFFEGKGRLDILSYNQLMIEKDQSDCLFDFLKETDTVVSLRFIKTNILGYGNAMKVLSNILITLKQLRELSLEKCSLDQEKCKILADSLMRMKKLQIFKLNDQKGLGQGLASIIYNLSFSPNLHVLELKDIQISNTRTPNALELTETVVSLFKMLRINSSIEILKINNVYNLNPQLNKEFWSALGDCKSLRVLDLSGSGQLSAKAKEMGAAVAFNAKRKGVLSYLNLTGTFSSTNTINNFYLGMNVSEYDEQQWYGDPNKVAKMIPGNYKKQFFNNLKGLQLNTCKNLNPTFVLSHYNKLINKVEPDIVKLLGNSPNLNSLQLQSTNLQRNIADVLVLALDSRREGLKCQLKVIDLSKNNLQKEGVKLLAEVLPHNKVLEVLDLSKNNIGVSGADELAKSLKANKSLKYLNVFNNKISYDGAKSIADNIIANNQTLQFLEIGHNRIRDKGFSSIVNAFVANPKSKIQILGVRFNFLTNAGVLQNISHITSAKTSLEEVFIRNNLVNEEGVYKLRQLIDSSKSEISIDLLERVKYLDQDRLDRTVWIHPISAINLAALKKFFEIEHKCGIVVDFRVRNGRKYPNRQGDNKFCFVEFADAASANEALGLAARGLTSIGGRKFRIFKAGTGTFIYSKKTAKQKKLELAKNTLPQLPFPVMPMQNVADTRSPSLDTFNRPPRPNPPNRSASRGRGRGRRQ